MGPRVPYEGPLVCPVTFDSTRFSKNSTWSCAPERRGRFEGWVPDTRGPRPTTVIKVVDSKGDPTVPEEP